VSGKNGSIPLDPTGDLRADMLVALEYGVHPMVRETRPTRPSYRCDDCGKETTTRATLTMHRRHMHGA
jgi:hypothetical protein